MIIIAVPVMPQWSKIVFLSGDIVWLYREYSTIKNGVPHKKLLMILDEAVVNRYKIIPKQLTYDDWGQGVYIAEFPSEYYNKISDNPENPVILMLCGFYGEPILKNKLSVMAKQLNEKETQITDLMDENQRQREKIKSLMEKIGVLKEVSVNA